MYSIFEQLLKQSGERIKDVSEATGIRAGVFSDWKNGRYTPKIDKLMLIAQHFGVSLEYLTNGEKAEKYYLNEKTAEIAQKVFDDPNLRLLFDAAQDVDPENIRLAAEMLLRFKETNPNG